jgi:hypothetical protein
VFFLERLSTFLSVSIRVGYLRMNLKFESLKGVIIYPAKVRSLEFDSRELCFLGLLENGRRGCT